MSLLSLSRPVVCAATVAALTFVQPFAADTWPLGLTPTANTETTHDWEAEERTVPLNLLATRVLKAGAPPISRQRGGRHYADAPPGGRGWGLRAALPLLFPRGERSRTRCEEGICGRFACRSIPTALGQASRSRCDDTI